MGLSVKCVCVCVWWGMCSKSSTQPPRYPIRLFFFFTFLHPPPFLLPSHYSCQTFLHSRGSSPVPPPLSEGAELWLSPIKELPPYRPLQLAWIGHHCWKTDGEGRGVGDVEGRIRSPDHSRKARERRHINTHARCVIWGRDFHVH